MMAIFQPDSHGHKRLQPLGVATLEATLLCPEQTTFCHKINEELDYLFVIYLNHHSKVWFLIGHEEFWEVRHSEVLLRCLNQNLGDGVASLGWVNHVLVSLDAQSIQKNRESQNKHGGALTSSSDRSLAGAPAKLDPFKKVKKNTQKMSTENPNKKGGSPTSSSDQKPCWGTSQARLGSLLCSPTISSALTTHVPIVSPTWWNHQSPSQFISQSRVLYCTSHWMY